MSIPLTDAQTLLAFKAGRSFRRPNTNLVDANPTKGAIVLANGEDGLLHFFWKERPNGRVHEDLILFPGDATLEKVSQERSGRTYVLRFESSDQKHFDASSARDAELVSNLNRLLEDPSAPLDWDSTSQAQAAPSAPASSQGPSSSSTARGAQAAGPPAGIATPEQLARLRALVTSMGASTGAATTSNSDDEVVLSDILTPANLIPLFTSHPTLLPALFPHLPPELLPQQQNGPLTPQQTAQLTETLQRTINSPPFRAAVTQLDRALQTGALGDFVRSLGLPESAGTGIGAFLRAIEDQARKGGSGGSGREDSMDED
ncbi:hypothetical protein ID866_3122 [Astraeus odoratus]|nr:hypothetical protein ID866_3122 [Astraeus odoratus]